MTPGGRPTALLAPLLTIWPTNTGLYLHKPVQCIHLTTPSSHPRCRREAARSPPTEAEAGRIDASAAGSTEPLGGTRRGAGRQLAQFDDFTVVCDVTLTMPMSTALRRLMAAERPPTEAGDRTYRRRCGGIN